ncbi:Nucleolar protein 56 [Thelohanellus kitauei]|nr:Nucleolar protein 56 [Thelohanellus kitauei]
MIIQSISLVEQLDKDINTFNQRIREWYSYHFPELYTLVSNNLLYAKAVSIVGNRATFNEESLEKLSELLNSQELADKVLLASKSSIGMDIMDIDLKNIEHFCVRVIDLASYKEYLLDYLISKMNLIAPNLSSVIGEQVGAKLISQAGSLRNLAKCPASTVQILGAEKSLFRAIKTRGKTPKYGLIYHSSFIGRSPFRYKGRISRFLAHKCSLASRIDSFSDNPNNIIGKRLHQQIEDRLGYFIKGEPEDENQIPKSNAEVMKEAVEELNKYNKKLAKKEKKKKRLELQSASQIQV